MPLLEEKSKENKKSSLRSTPVKTTEDDSYELGWTALHLALTLSESHAYGNVIALLGKWGSGKTSAIEMARNLLESARPVPADELRQPAPGIARAAPGPSAQEQVNALASALHGKLQHLAIGSVPRTFWRETAQILRSSRIVFEEFNPWEQATETHFGIALVELAYSHLFAGRVGYGQMTKVWRMLRRNPAAAVGFSVGVLNATWAVTSMVRSFFESGVQVQGSGIEAQVDIDLKKLESEAKKLKEAFGEGSHNVAPLVVLIDDVDRMPPGRIHELLLALRWMEDLQACNISFLLLFDPEHVVDGLARTHFFADDMSRARRHAAAFMEKIIHYSIQLPAPRPEALLAQFENLLQDARRDFDLKKKIDGLDDDGIFEGDSRWQAIRSLILARYLITPRAVNRLATSIKITWSAKRFYSGVDPRDLIAIEAIQLFDRPLFEMLQGMAVSLPEGRSWQDPPGEMSSDHKRILRLLLSRETERRYRCAEWGLSNPEMRDVYLFGVAPANPRAGLLKDYMAANDLAGQAEALLNAARRESASELSRYVAEQQAGIEKGRIGELKEFLRSARDRALDRAREADEEDARKRLELLQI